MLCVVTLNKLKGCSQNPMTVQVEKALEEAYIQLPVVTQPYQQSTNYKFLQIKDVIHPHFDSQRSYICTSFIQVSRQWEEPYSPHLAPSWVVQISAIKSPTAQPILHIMHPWCRFHTTLATIGNTVFPKSCRQTGNVEIQHIKSLVSAILATMHP